MIRFVALVAVALLPLSSFADEISASDPALELGLPGLSAGSGLLRLARSYEPTPPGGGTADAEDPTGGPVGGVPEDPRGEPGSDPGEPDAAPGEPPPPPGATSPAAALARSDSATYGAGFQLRGIFVPTWFLDMFLDASTGLSSVGLGAEFIRRKGNLDIVGGLNFGFYSPPDGNYLGNGKSPAVETDYVDFRDLNVLALDVTFIWHHYFTPWLSMVYGAGLGMGFVLGDVYRISTYQGNCTADNIGDLSRCNPVPPGDQASLDKWNRSRDQWLADARKCSSGDSPASPCLFREDDVWPVVPVVHLLIGVNFKITEEISVRVDGGFHNAFFVGASGQYFLF